MADQKRQAALSVLSAGGTQAEAARRAEVNRSTITRWLADDAFKAELLARIDAEAAEPETLESLKSLAFGLIKGSLEGTRKATAAQLTTAVKIMQETREDASGGTTLAQRLEELDSRDLGQPD